MQARNRHFIGTCVGNPFRSVSELSDVIDWGRNVSRETFLKNCNIEDDEELYGNNLKKAMREYPNDFEYFKSKHQGKDVYFFTHSAIEYFYE